MKDTQNLTTHSGSQELTKNTMSKGHFFVGQPTVWFSLINPYLAYICKQHTPSLHLQATHTQSMFKVSIWFPLINQYLCSKYLFSFHLLSQATQAQSTLSFCIARPQCSLYSIVNVKICKISIFKGITHPQNTPTPSGYWPGRRDRSTL